jgi:uncharacterized protein
VTPLALWVLLGLFVIRVVGQILVGLDVLHAGGLVRPWDEWQSGLLPYPWLLVSQLLIVVTLAKASADVSRGRGYFARPNRTLGKGLILFGCVYAFGMGIRYWLQGGLSIPIIFHWVLAGYLVVFGAFHLRSARAWYSARST